MPQEIQKNTSKNRSAQYTCYIKVVIGGIKSDIVALEIQQEYTASITQQAMLMIAIPQNIAPQDLLNKTCSIKYNVVTRTKSYIFLQQYIITETIINDKLVHKTIAAKKDNNVVVLILKSPAVMLKKTSPARYWNNKTMTSIIYDLTTPIIKTIDLNVRCSKAVNFLYQKDLDNYHMLLGLIRKYCLYASFYCPNQIEKPPLNNSSDRATKDTPDAMLSLLITDNPDIFTKKIKSLRPFQYIINSNKNLQHNIINKNYLWHTIKTDANYLKNCFLFRRAQTSWRNNLIKITPISTDEFFYHNHNTKKSSHIRCNKNAGNKIFASTISIPPKNNTYRSSAGEQITDALSPYQKLQAHEKQNTSNAPLGGHEAVGIVVAVKNRMVCEIRIPSTRQEKTTNTEGNAPNKKTQDDSVFITGENITALVITPKKHRHAEFSAIIAVGTYVYAIYDPGIQNTINRKDNGDLTAEKSKGTWIIMGSIPEYAYRYSEKISSQSKYYSLDKKIKQQGKSCTNEIEKEILQIKKTNNYLPEKIYSCYSLLTNDHSRLLLRDITNIKNYSNNTNQNNKNFTSKFWQIGFGSGIFYKSSFFDGWGFFADNNKGTIKSTIQLSSRGKFICHSSKDIKYNTGNDYNLTSGGYIHIYPGSSIDLAAKQNIKILSTGKQTYNAASLQLSCNNYRLSAANAYVTATSKINFNSKKTINISNTKSYSHSDNLHIGDPSTSSITISAPGASISLSATKIELKAATIQIIANNAILPSLPKN